MKRAGILSIRWAAAAAGLVLPRGLGAQIPAQGIKVHGHWVIEVRNADRTLQLRREFENALTTNGQQALAQMFGGHDAQLWEVNVGSVGGYICNPPGAPCVLVEPSSTRSGTNIFKNLAKTASGNQVILQGSFIVANDATGLVVSTNVLLGGYAGGNGIVTYPVFTTADVTAPTSVQATQTVSVTVTFTFS